MRKIKILTWPSASGKTTLAEALLRLPWWEKPINYTTRQPRNDKELDDYVFLTEKQYFKKMQNGDFLTTTSYSWNYYATWNINHLNDIVLVLAPDAREQVVSKCSSSHSIATYFLAIDEETQADRLMERDWVIDENRVSDIKTMTPSTNCILLEAIHPHSLLLNLLTNDI